MEHVLFIDRRLVKSKGTTLKPLLEYLNDLNRWLSNAWFKLEFKRDTYKPIKRESKFCQMILEQNTVSPFHFKSRQIRHRSTCYEINISKVLTNEIIVFINGSIFFSSKSHWNR